MNLNQAMTIRAGASPFPTMQEMEEWFENKYCPIDVITVVASTPVPFDVEKAQARADQITGAISPRAVRRAEWLRRAGNEEWHGQRLAIVQTAWNMLKERHDQTVGHYRNQLEESRRRVAEIEWEFKALSEKKDQLERSRRTVRDLVEISIVALKKIRSLKKVVAGFQVLLATELKP